MNETLHPGERHPIFAETPHVCGIVSPDGDKACVLLAGHEGEHGWSDTPEAEHAFLWWLGMRALGPGHASDPVLEAKVGALREAFHAGWNTSRGSQAPQAVSH